MALAALLGFLTVFSSAALMVASAWIITRAALQPSIATLQVAIVSVRAFGIARGVARYLERLVSHEATFRLLARLRVWFYTALEPLAPARLAEYPGGDLLARLVADIETLQEFYVRVVAPPAVAAMVGVGLGVFLWAYEPAAALAALACYALAGAGLPLLTRWLSREPARVMVNARADLNAALLDGVQGAADLIAYGAAVRHGERVAALSTRLTTQQARMARINGMQRALGGLLLNMAMIGALWASIGRVPGIDLAVVALAIMAGFEAAAPLPTAFGHLETSIAAAGRLLEVVDAPPAVADPPAPLPSPATYDLVVEDLRFSYTPGLPPALDGVSFRVPAGGCVAVVGPSGAGKSTLANLLQRFWDYDAGRVTLGGRELRDLAQDDLRALVGVVAQRTHLFNATIRENIALARPDALIEQVIAAAQAAQIHDFIAALPEGYDTRAGELGVRLSGGERQRVAIARALLKDAPMLVLDEATANLDAITERAVMRTLRRAMAGRTTLIITHRLVELEACDKIIVLRAGRVAERGTHSSLVQTRGLYYRLWAQQHGLIALETMETTEHTT
jgi:ATP-binding cassette subfamily C protein CydC